MNNITYFSNGVIVFIWNLQQTANQLPLLLHQLVHGVVRHEQLIYRRKKTKETPFQLTVCTTAKIQAKSTTAIQLLKNSQVTY